MCYSAEVWADYNHYVKEFGADIDIKQFVKLYLGRQGSFKMKTPRGMDMSFAHPKGEQELSVRNAIREFNVQQEADWEADLEKQRVRLEVAQNKLLVKETKTALNEQRIATDNIAKLEGKLADIHRRELKPKIDNRIFPMVYCPVLIVEDGKKVVRPMRYLLRPPGAPPSFDFDKNRNGTYNARRDNLERFWKRQFGYTHGLIVATTFYENVEGQDGKNRVVEFTPRTGEPMYIACLWAHWTDPKGIEPDLYSFAAITDEPEPEVLAAGHDRTIINIRPEHIDAWLTPDPNNLAEMHAIFDDKQHPYYVHKVQKAA